MGSADRVRSQRESGSFHRIVDVSNMQASKVSEIEPSSRIYRRTMWAMPAIGTLLYPVFLSVFYEFVRAWEARPIRREPCLRGWGW
jgi:hypothetical protein